MKIKLLLLLLFAITRCIGQNTEIDKSFGKNGSSYINFYDSISIIGNIKDFDADDDGNIYILSTYDFETGGSNIDIDNPVIKVNASGLLDSTFYENGFRQAGIGFIYDADFIKLSAEKNRLYVFAQNGFSLYTVKFKLNGLLDSTFGTNGYKILAVGNTVVKDIFMLPGGGFIVAGTALTNDGYNVVTNRFTSNGALDESYSAIGETIIPFNNVSFKYCYGMLMTSGAIVISAVEGNLNNRGTDSIVLMKIAAKGGLDSSFGSSGLVRNASFTADYFDDMVHDRTMMLPDSSILVIKVLRPGYLSQFKFTKAGNIDTSFGPKGVRGNDFLLNNKAVPIGLYKSPTDLNLWMNGIKKSNYGDVGCYIVAKFKADGNLDTSSIEYSDPSEPFYRFGINFYKSYATSINNRLVQPYQTLADGLIRIGKLNTDASLDTSAPSKRGFEIKASNERLLSLKPLSNGKMVGFALSGDSATLFGVDSNGLADKTFGNGGTKAMIDYNTSANSYSFFPLDAHLLIDNKDRIIFFHRKNINDNDYSFFIERFTYDGSHDSIFGTNGIMEIKNTVQEVWK